MAFDSASPYNSSSAKFLNERLWEKLCDLNSTHERMLFELNSAKSKNTVSTAQVMRQAFSIKKELDELGVLLNSPTRANYDIANMEASLTTINGKIKALGSNVEALNRVQNSADMLHELALAGAKIDNTATQISQKLNLTSWEQSSQFGQQPNGVSHSSLANPGTGQPHGHNTGNAGHGSQFIPPVTGGDIGQKDFDNFSLQITQCSHDLAAIRRELDLFPAMSVDCIAASKILFEVRAMAKRTAHQIASAPNEIEKQHITYQGTKTNTHVAEKSSHYVNAKPNLPATIPQTTKLPLATSKPAVNNKAAEAQGSIIFGINIAKTMSMNALGKSAKSAKSGTVSVKSMGASTSYPVTGASNSSIGMKSASSAITAVEASSSTARGLTTRPIQSSTASASLKFDEEAFKVRLVRSMLDASEGKMIIDKKNLTIKSTHTGSRTSFAMDTNIRNAIASLFDNPSISDTIGLILRNEDALVVANFSVGYQNKEPNSLKISIGNRKSEENTVTFSPINMYLPSGQLSAISSLDIA